jgi:hypothetical protein
MLDRFIQISGTDQNAPWEEMYGKLVDFKDQNGHCCIPEIYLPCPELRRWLHRQRFERNMGRLPATLEGKLETLGVIWSAKEDDFLGMIHELERFKATHGHCRVPFDHPPNPKLGKWLKGIINTKRQNLLSENKVARLTSLGVEWDRNIHEEKWNAMFKVLVGFKENHGHCNVPRSYPENQSLAVWLETQRTNERYDRISADRKGKLSGIGVTWRNRNGRLDGWNKRISELKLFKETHGHCNVDWNHTGGLGLWILGGKYKQKKGLLSSDRENELVSMGIDFNATKNDSKWDEMHGKLIEYKKEFGHCNVSHAKNKKLSNWIKTMKHKQSKGLLDPERESKLTDLGMAWIESRPSNRGESNA